MALRQDGLRQFHDDLFHEDVPDDYICAVARIMVRADWHTYRVLTKRAERMGGLLQTKLSFAAEQPHIWWGVSVENRRHGLPRIDSSAIGAGSNPVPLRRTITGRSRRTRSGRYPFDSGGKPPNLAKNVILNSFFPIVGRLPRFGGWPQFRLPDRSPMCMCTPSVTILGLFSCGIGRLMRTGSSSVTEEKTATR